MFLFAVSQPAIVAPVVDPTNPWQYSMTGPQFDAYRPPVNDRPSGIVGAGTDDTSHARGGNGIFGEPMVT